MDPKNNERPPMVHRETPSGNSNKDYSRRPMVKPRESFSHKAAILLAKIGLGATVATGGAGAIHHATNFELGGPVPVGATSDIIQSGVMDKIVELSISSGPQQEQKDLDQEKAITEALFKPTEVMLKGQIEVDIAKLSEARTKEILLAIRLGKDYEKVDPRNIKAVDNISTELDSKLIIDNPTVVNLIGQGLGRYFTATITTDKNTEPVLLPESSVTTTIPGEFKLLSTVTDLPTLDAARVLYPTK